MNTVTVLGAGLAMTLYQLFAGYAGAYGIMTAVSGLLLSLMALGGGEGWLRTLAVSLTAKKRNGERTMNGGKVKSLLLGLAGGFVLAAFLSPLRCPFWIPLIVAVVGLVLSFVLKEKGGAPA